MFSLNDIDPSTYNGIVYSAYGYIPSESIAILFVALFSISTIFHIGQSVYFRMWWLLPTAVLCGVMEILGWSARLWSSISPTMQTPFIIQITATILAPTPLVAANFVILGKVILSLGPAYSRLSPRWYAIVFCTCDIVSLVVQAAGGAMASSASGNGYDPTPGGDVMLGGIIFQMTTITIYVVCAIEFFVRYLKNLPIRLPPLINTDGKRSSIRGYMDKRLKTMCVALSFSTVCLFIRSVYRTIELVDGWNGKVIHTQVYFNVLDGAMIVLAMYTLNLVHPGSFLTSSGLSTRDSSNEDLVMKRMNQGNFSTSGSFT